MKSACSVSPSSVKMTWASTSPTVSQGNESTYSRSSWISWLARPRRQSVRSFLNTSCDVGDELRHLGRRRADGDAARLQRLLLALGRSGRAGDDRTGVAHRLARRRGEAGDVGEHGLRHGLLDEARGLLLLVAADLSDHDHVLGLGIGLELGQDVDEGRADDGIAADADDGGVAEPELRELVPDLVR